MADASVRGYLGSYNTGTTAMTVAVPTDAYAPVVGDWMIVTIVDTTTGTQSFTPPTPPSGSGWVTLLPHTAIGSRFIQMFGKRRVAGEVNYLFTATQGSTANASIVYGPGGALDPSTWAKGTFTKAASTVTSLTLPSMTTTTKSAIIAIWGMGITNAGETDAQNTVAAPFTKIAWTATAATGVSVNKTFLAGLAQTAAGATGTATYTRPTAAANFGGMMIAIPSLADAPVVTITSPAAGTVTNPSLHVTGTSTTPGKTIYLANGPTGNLGPDWAPATTTAADGSFDFTPYTAMTDGEQRYYHVAQDNGDGSFAGADVIVTYHAPVADWPFGVTVPSWGTVVTTPYPTWSGTGTPGCLITVEDPSGGANYASTNVKTDGTWSATFTRALVDGVNVTLRVAQANTDGSYSTANDNTTYQAPAVAHLPGRIVDGGAVVAGGYQIYDGTKLAELSSMQLVRKGRKVSELYLDGHVPVIAHRLGSVDYPEHSLRGATQCAIEGVDALEFSIAITSDGKLFGLHDATLNRTSPAAPANYDPKLHTWAEIQAFQCSVGDAAGFGPQPYMLLSDLVAAYGKTHTLVLDPKTIGSANLPAFYAYVQTIPDYRERVILKYFHTGTTVGDAAKAMGVKSWGYSYTADVQATGSQSTAATASHWDYLGLEYSADQATWTSILAIAGTKPVWGHICPTNDAANTALARGAKGLMVSGVRSVMAARYYLDKATTVPTGPVTRNGITRQLAYSQDFNTPAITGSVRSTYPGMGYYDTATQGFPDTSKQGYYAPDKVLSVANGVLDMHMYVENGQPLVACVMPDNYTAHTYGRFDIRYKTTQAPNKGFKFVAMWWPSSDVWNEGEIDYPEADLGERPRPASARPGSYSNGSMSFAPGIEIPVPTDTADFHVASSEWNQNGLFFYWDDQLVWSTTDTTAIPKTPFRVTLQAETFINEGPVPATADGHVLIDWIAIWA